MKQEKMFAVVKNAGEESQIKLIEKDTKLFSMIVEGKREIIPFPTMPGVCLIINGEALKNNKKPNCFLPEYNDLLLGTVIVSGIDLEVGFLSLTEEQAEKIENYLKTNDAGSLTGNIAEKVKTEYISNSDETYVYSLLSEVKTKFKNIKVKWMAKK